MTFAEIMAGANAVIDPTLGAAVTYTPQGEAALDIVAIIEHEEDSLDEPGDFTQRAPVAYIRFTDLAREPARGDSISDGTNYWLVDTYDRQQYDWRIQLRLDDS